VSIKKFKITAKPAKWKLSKKCYFRNHKNLLEKNNKSLFFALWEGLLLKLRHIKIYFLSTLFFWNLMKKFCWNFYSTWISLNWAFLSPDFFDDKNLLIFIFIQNIFAHEIYKWLLWRDVLRLCYCGRLLQMLSEKNI
jgi:hypothetical protein